jgi:hypothetical protein
MKALTQDQIDAVVHWMNNWEQLKNTAIPIRFKEDWTKPYAETEIPPEQELIEIAYRLGRGYTCALYGTVCCAKQQKDTDFKRLVELAEELYSPNQ